jgi:hypothetical protein
MLPAWMTALTDYRLAGAFLGEDPGATVDKRHRSSGERFSGHREQKGADDDDCVIRFAASLDA